MFVFTRPPLVVFVVFVVFVVVVVTAECRSDGSCQCVACTHGSGPEASVANMQFDAMRNLGARTMLEPAPVRCQPIVGRPAGGSLGR